MMRYIVATDGSESSLKAVRFLAQRFPPGPEDEVFVIYVFPLPPDLECYRGVVTLPSDASDDRVRQVAKPVLAKAVEILADCAASLEEVILLGNPAKEIVEFAMNLHVDLIVAGTKGRSAEKELYLGSVSSALSQCALCSVLIVR
jgi:nucleotide-binding universal stress UspA family protein